MLATRLVAVCLGSSHVLVLKLSSMDHMGPLDDRRRVISLSQADDEGKLRDLGP